MVYKLSIIKNKQTNKQIKNKQTKTSQLVRKAYHFKDPVFWLGVYMI